MRPLPSPNARASEGAGWEGLYPPHLWAPRARARGFSVRNHNPAGVGRDLGDGQDSGRGVGGRLLPQGPAAYLRLWLTLDRNRPYLLTGLVEENYGAVTLAMSGVRAVARRGEGLTKNQPEAGLTQRRTGPHQDELKPYKRRGTKPMSRKFLSRNDFFDL